MTKSKKLDNQSLDEHTLVKIKPWQKMLASNNRIFAINAKIAIANILADRGYKREALGFWRSVKKEDNEKLFQVSRLSMGDFLIKSIDEEFVKENIQEARRCFVSIKNRFRFNAENKIFICDMLLKDEYREFGKKILKLFNVVYNILSILKVDVNSAGNRSLHAERKLAHYTSVDTTNLLLKADKDKKLPSSFRLNTISNVNDPSEGQVLDCCLLDNEKIQLSKPESYDVYHAFIGCFKFNHDSLNQFRLYGKKNDKEASGFSLVFNKGFFKESENPDDLSFISFDYDGEGSQEKGGEGDKRGFSYIKPQSVMRCVYIDPESGFVSLAQRNKITFYREYFQEDKSGNKAEESWIQYQKIIDKKTKRFKNEFLELKRIHKNIVEDISQMIDKEQSNVSQVLNNILLPLKFLIKHTAFQEEQECRIVYITTLDNPKVQMDFGKFLYVEYEPEVKANLDKIYIAPAATQYQPYLAKLLCDTDVKIELSNNPFRLPTSH